MKLLHCILYLGTVGIIIFVLGRVVPKRWFDSRSFPWRSFEWEHGGRIYNKLKIKTWQNKLPDMSKICTKIMPPKKMVSTDRDRIIVMLQETCIAEITHVVLILLSLECLEIWDGIGGIICTVIYIAANIPYVIMQRYNRARLQKLIDREDRVMSRENDHDRSGAYNGDPLGKLN